MSDFDTADLHELVSTAHRDWKSGKKVLIRCQAGINRSGLIMALVLIRDGMNPEDAIELMRTKRARSVLRNQTFENWLREVTPEDWRA
jgi:protein-tyrosine phosphatase